jgi:hypothetical protein
VPYESFFTDEKTLSGITQTLQEFRGATFFDHSQMSAQLVTWHEQETGKMITYSFLGCVFRSVKNSDRMTWAGSLIFVEKGVA